MRFPVLDQEHLHCGGGIAGDGEESFGAGFLAPGFVFADADFIGADFYRFVDCGASGVAAVNFKLSWGQIFGGDEVGLERDGSSAIGEFEIDREIAADWRGGFCVAFLADGLLEFVQAEPGGIFRGGILRKSGRSREPAYCDHKQDPRVTSR